MEVVNKYQNGKIYKLVHDDKVIYVGSTISKLNKRFVEHKGKSKRNPDRKIYKFISNVGWNNVNIELIENFNCNNKKELELRERYYIELLKPDLNHNIPTRTTKEYHEEYYQNNKQTLTERFLCDCGQQYTKTHKARHEKTKIHQNYINQNNDNQVNI